LDELRAELLGFKQKVAIGGNNEIFRELYPIPVVPPELQALREKRTEKRTNVYQKAQSSGAQKFNICIGWSNTGSAHLLNPHMFTNGKLLDYPPMSPQPESITKSMLGDRWIIAKCARPADSFTRGGQPTVVVQIAAVELFIDNKGGVWRQGAPPPPNVGESMPMAFQNSVTGILNNTIQTPSFYIRMHINCKDPVCTICHPYEYVTSKLSELQKCITPIHDWIAVWKDCDDFQKEYDEIYKTKFADYDKELQAYNERIKERNNIQPIPPIER